MKALVVLVHGLWMNPLAMFPLRRSIRNCGFSVDRFSYATVEHGLQENAARLSRFLSRLDAPTVHLVGHSLGGVVILAALKEQAEPRVRRIVLLGSPVAGSTAGRTLARSRPGMWMLGSSLPIWSERPPPQTPDGVEVGVIAGNLSLGLGRLITRLPKPNDGVVTVAETTVVNATDSILLPVSHTAMLISRSVARNICAFLSDGRFEHN